MAEERQGKRRSRWRRFIVVLLLLVASSLALRAWLRPASIEDGSVVLLRLEGRVGKAAGTSSLRLLPSRSFPLLDVLQTLRALGDDDRVAGLVVRVRGMEEGWATVQDVREELGRLREKGKRVVAYLEPEFLNSSLEYYLASAAGEVILPAAASAPLTGLSAQYMFLGGFWEKLSVRMEVERIGAYKTAADTIDRRGMSPEHREMTDWLLDSVYGELVDGIALARKLPAEEVRAIIDRAPMTAAEYEELGLADGLSSLEDLRRELLGKKRRFLAFDDYRRSLAYERDRKAEGRISLVRVVGPIRTGDGPGGWDSESAAEEEVTRALDEARRDEKTRAIVLRVDSPGGSALASDLIWQAVRRADRKKPVIVSMGDVAASGGYYVASGARRILARPGTITGSIGVVIARPDVSGLLNRLGIATVTVSRGERARLSSVVDPLSDAERERITAATRNVYRLFLERVAEARNLAPEAVDAVGQGRVWTGQQAMDRQLVDEMGGLLDAIERARVVAGVGEAEEVEVRVLPEPAGVVEWLESLLDRRAAARLPAALQRVRDVAVRYDWPPGSVLTLMPHELAIR